MAGWRYLAFRLNGDGTETLLTGELPLSGATLVRNLSAPHRISGALEAPLAELIADDGKPLVSRWGTSVYAEDPNGKLWVGSIVIDTDIDGPRLSVDAGGFTSAPKGQLYDGDESLVQWDVFDVVRLAWAHYQDGPGADLGLEIDQHDSGVLIGTPSEQVEFETTAGQQVSFEAGPVKLNWWNTTDLGGKLDQLAETIPFDTLEEHEWDGEQIRHRLRLGYPSIGNRLTGPRFVLGENVSVQPAESLPGEDIVTEVVVLGAGEGRERIRGGAAMVPRNSIRRVKTIQDKNITSKSAADRRARDELAIHRGEGLGAGISTLIIDDHPNAQFGTYDVGDQILYSGDHDWGEVDIWVKILSLQITPDSSSKTTATVMRMDRFPA